MDLEPNAAAFGMGGESLKVLGLAVTGESEHGVRRDEGQEQVEAAAERTAETAAGGAWRAGPAPGQLDGGGRSAGGVRRRVDGEDKPGVPTHRSQHPEWQVL